MADIFIEHIVKKKKTTATRMMGVLYIFGLVVVIMLTLAIEILFMIMPLAVLGGVWLVVRLIQNLDLEFEYIVTNGEVDIDRISGKRKRKRLASVDCRTFEILALDTPQNFSAYQNAQFVQKLDASSGDSPRWFAICPSKQGGKMLLYFEPNERMMDAFKLYNQRVIKQ